MLRGCQNTHQTNKDDRYFTDTYQAMPLYGYTKMFEKMFSHPNIKIMLNTDYKEIVDVIPYKNMIYTGPLINISIIVTGSFHIVRLTLSLKQLMLKIFNQQVQ